MQMGQGREGGKQWFWRKSPPFSESWPRGSTLVESWALELYSRCVILHSLALWLRGNCLTSLSIIRLTYKWAISSQNTMR